MSFAKQRATIDAWSRRASACQAERTRHRDAMRDWKRERLARPSTLAMAFAAGAWLGSGRQLGRQAAHSTKKVFGLMNSSLIAWRLFGTQAHDG
jgi:hypothetical protein